MRGSSERPFFERRKGGAIKNGFSRLLREELLRRCTHLENELARALARLDKRPGKLERLFRRRGRNDDDGEEGERRDAVR